jgi:hypothetical protein
MGARDSRRRGKFTGEVLVLTVTLSVAKSPIPASSGDRAHLITTPNGDSVECLSDEASAVVSERDSGLLGSKVRDQIQEAVCVDVCKMSSRLVHRRCSFRTERERGNIHTLDVETLGAKECHGKHSVAEGVEWAAVSARPDVDRNVDGGAILGPELDRCQVIPTVRQIDGRAYHRDATRTARSR